MSLRHKPPSYFTVGLSSAKVRSSFPSEMPTLAVAKNFLFSLLGTTYTEPQFEALCFEFGVELDDVTSAREMFIREHGTGKDVAEKAASLSDEVIYKIDTPANRYDLLSAEGMSLALKVFKGAMITPRFNVLNRSNPLYKMYVDSSIKGVRDFVVCAVLKDIRFNTNSYNSFIDFQEKLHSGLARRRTLASVGTHDMRKLDVSKLRYTVQPKEAISFVPLNQTRILNCAGDGLEQYYKDDRHIGKFVPLISKLPGYPTILDGSGTLMSLPPIINSDFSKISIDTTDVFIECTAPDHHKASVLVNQIVCAFSAYCKNPFTVEAVEVIYEGAKPTREVTPNLDTREMTVDLQTVNQRVGINLATAEDCASLLNKMCLYATKVDERLVKVDIPAIRSDILHPCDLIEDVAIAYGYDNIVMTETPTKSSGFQVPVNKLTHLLRLEIANAGYTEILTFSLCSKEEAFKQLGREDTNVAVHIANPQTIEFQVCRPSLLPGTLKTFNASKSLPLPMKLFEVSDVVMLDNSVNFPPSLDGTNRPKYNPTGCRNEKHVAALHCAVDTSGFEDIHGLVEYILGKIGVPQRFQGEAIASSDDYYFVCEGRDGAYFPGRAMDIVLVRGGVESRIGHLGVLHPNTLKAYDIPFPCSYCEINVQPFV